MAKDNGRTARYEGPRKDTSADSVKETRQVHRNEVPEGSVLEVEQWVSGDVARATVALKAEKAKGSDARSTLIESLERVIDRPES